MYDIFFTVQKLKQTIHQKVKRIVREKGNEGDFIKTFW